MKVVNTVDEVCLYTPNWAFALQEFRPYVFLTYIWPSSKILNKKEAWSSIILFSVTNQCPNDISNWLDCVGEKYKVWTDVKPFV